MAKETVKEKPPVKVMPAPSKQLEENQPPAKVEPEPAKPPHISPVAPISPIPPAAKAEEHKRPAEKPAPAPLSKPRSQVTGLNGKSSDGKSKSPSSPATAPPSKSGATDLYGVNQKPPSPPAPLPKGEGRKLPVVVKPAPVKPAAPATPPEPRSRVTGLNGAGSAEQSKPPVVVKPAPGKPVAPMRVNADELDARIGGCNMAFRELESDLDEKGTWDAARIGPLVEKLKILVVRRGDLELYREMLSAAERSHIDKLESPKSSVSQLGARIFEARRRTSAPEFKGTEEERQKELDRLEALSRRLVEVTGKEKKAERKWNSGSRR